MKLHLKNPVIFFDLETTGTDIVSDRIVEISFLKVMPSGEEITKTKRIHPGIPVPPEAVAIHGITDEDVKDAPSFKSIARSLAEQMQGCDIAGYNSDRFDIPFLAEEFLRAGIDADFLKKARQIDVRNIFIRKEPRTLSAAYRFFCNKNLENAHSAEEDTKVTYEILKAQLDRYKDLENDVSFLSEYSLLRNPADFAGKIIYNEDGKEVFNFGKYKGKVVEEIFIKDAGYYQWMTERKFPLYTKKVIKEIWERIKK